MAGSTLGLIIISMMIVIMLSAWLVLAFCADAHPGWRRQVPSGLDMADPAAPAATRRQQDNLSDASRQTEESTAAGSDAAPSTLPAAGLPRTQ